MRGFTGWRAWCRLAPEWRDLAFYSESGQDWHHFEPLVRELAEKLNRKLTYVSSDPGDPGLAYQHANVRTVCIPPGWFLTIHFQFQRAGVVVLTMMDLDQLQLKRSINGVHYAYVFHSMGSTHMVDHANSYDAYDSLLCPGPQHVAELRKREGLAGLKPRNLINYGYPRLEQLRAETEAHPPRGNVDEPVVLVAPTWGPDSIFMRCGRELMTQLLEGGCRVIMRPHYHTRRQAPAVLDALIAEFRSHPRFELIEQMGEKASLYHSDLLVSDWSAMAIEYALGLEKPVLFIDLPRRVRNPGWEAWGIEPLESAIRSQVGEILSPSTLAEAPAVVRRLVAEPGKFRERMQALRTRLVFEGGAEGSCVPGGARAIAALADAHSLARAGHAP